jgi:putative cardiolipin synthase
VDSVRYSVLDMIRGARREVVISSPYLIPGERGMALFAAKRAQGVALRVVTNALAATDEPLVHGGYRRYRHALLAMGVELHELSPVRVQRSRRLGLLFAATLGRLHAKTVVVDRERLFIGSMNFDPRSERLNTEMGVFIDSPPLAREALRLMDLDKLQAAYRLALAPDGQGLRWLATDDEGEVAYDTEPDTGWWTRLWLELLWPLAPEELL